ncbi:hypothetical protein [Roseibacillus persicicus]|uniref:hypothetical protein n=1 Tax=Roseibacillus persicicus TaxID=454148 RepID=UPI00280D2008|nr:hypothetical protein [Roseibacillus persicicus]MDQ8188832.1 hypothetical protein [Roseibacillus persicicus]
MKRWLLWLLTLTAVTGEEFTLKVAGVEDEILVSLPGNHDAAKSWPAVFYYHGTNGRPDTSLIRAHTGEDDWIVVGMGYAKRGTFVQTPAGLADEVKVLKEVRARLIERANLDPSRIYLSGFSKGGWVSGLLLQSESTLAGAAILGAGHMTSVESVPRPLTKGTPVFVGVGRYDRNYPFGLRALVFYRQLGAEVDFEEWRGIGHKFPKAGSRGLMEWLSLQLGQVSSDDELKERLKSLLAMEDGFEKWWRLRELAESPAVRAKEGWKEKVEAHRIAAEKDPKIAREARILKESRRLLAREIGKKSLKDLEEITIGYARIAESAGDSPQGVVATKDYERVSEILDLAKKQYGDLEERAQADEVKPELPEEKRRIPGNPLVR